MRVLTIIFLYIFRYISVHIHTFYVERRRLDIYISTVLEWDIHESICMIHICSLCHNLSMQISLTNFQNMCICFYSYIGLHIHTYIHTHTQILRKLQRHYSYLRKSILRKTQQDRQREREREREITIMMIMSCMVERIGIQIWLN